MQFPLKIESVLKIDEDGYLICTGKDYFTLLKPHQQKQSLKILQQIINQLGKLSSKAQSLPQIITSMLKFAGSDHRIYIKTKNNKALGYIKTGQKNLFYRDFVGSIKEIKPTCILDFYVHQSCQRTGIGKEIFQKFLNIENKIAEKLAYDRPSDKLISFLKKHYGLAKFIPQNNNFVIFDQYFTKSPPRPKQPIKQPSQKILQNSNPNYPQQPRPKSHLAPHNFQTLSTPSAPISSSQKYETKRQFKQYQKYSQHALQLKNKNQLNKMLPPLFVPANSNALFKTSANEYGNHYHYRKKC